jgi:electron transport complex protein RnfB
MDDDLARTIDAVLPQTQCGRCGFEACWPYAQAMARGEADTNRCPPGGESTARRLARMMGIPYQQLDPACGAPGPHRVAVIDEAWCIGCTACIDVCPVDAIVGASKLMHTVIEQECTGCELCVERCPMECIGMRAPTRAWPGWDRARAQLARQRYRAREERRKRRARQATGGARRQRAMLRAASKELKQTAIRDAVARVSHRHG